jgi:hypothetical protein
MAATSILPFFMSNIIKITPKFKQKETIGFIDVEIKTSGKISYKENKNSARRLLSSIDGEKICVEKQGFAVRKISKT